MAPITSAAAVSGAWAPGATYLPGSWAGGSWSPSATWVDGHWAGGSAEATPTAVATPTASSAAAQTTAEASKATASSAAVASSASAAAPSSASSSGGSKGNDKYTVYKGDGSSWPSVDQWVSDFDTMWNANLPLIKEGCSGLGVSIANTDEDNTNLKAAIQSAASGSKLDARFILAAVLQESKGCVRVKTTTYSVANPGLLQDHSGPGTCNPSGTPEQTCSKDMISQMINDGIFGTQSPGKAQGDGYMQTVQQAKSKGAQGDADQYYIGARIYNSGSYVANRLECGVATHCYASDIANRLTGWVNAPTGCQEASISAGCPSS